MKRCVLPLAMVLSALVTDVWGVGIGTIEDMTLRSGSPLHIPLNGLDANGASLSFEVTSDNPLVTPSVIGGNRSLRMSVTNTGDISGQMVFELFEGRAPRVTDHIIELAESGFYNGVTFHRVIDNFVIQGGDPTGTGGGGSPLGDFDDQFHVDLQHNRTGLLSMAKTTDDTNDSQFFVTELNGPASESNLRNLDFNHSVFGLLVEGENIREKISEVTTDGNPPGGSNRPLTNVVIESMEVFTDHQNAVAMLKAPEGASGQANITVTVTDAVGGQAQQTFQVTVEPDTFNGGPFLTDIPEISTTVDTPVTFQLTAIDAEGDSAFFLDENTLAGNGLPLPASELSHQDLDYDVNFTTGLVTVTPKNGLTGTHFITVATAVATNAVDYQAVPITIEVIPEPGTLGIVLLGTFSLLRGRHKSPVA